MLIKKKFVSLVIPFIVWSVIGFFMQSELDGINYMIEVVKQPDIGLWFLWILFLNFCVLAIVVKLQRFGKVIPTLLVMGSLFVIALKFRILGTNLLAWHFVFFYVGFAAIKYMDIIHKYEKRILTVSFIGFILLVPFWNFTESPLFLHNIQLTSILSNSYIQMIINFAYNYITAFAGILSVFCMVRKIRTNRIFAYLGTITIDIYVLHRLFLYGIGSGFIKIITMFAFALLCSIIVSFFIEKNKIFSALLFGKKVRY